MEEITIENAVTILGNITEHPGLKLSKAEHIVVGKALEVVNEFVKANSPKEDEETDN